MNDFEFTDYIIQFIEKHIDGLIIKGLSYSDAKEYLEKTWKLANKTYSDGYQEGHKDANSVKTNTSQ